MTKKTKRTTRIVLDWFLPVVFLTVATVYIRKSGIDVSLQTHFYKDNVGWIGGVQNPWLFLKTYGTGPALAMTIVSLGVLFASFWVKRIAGYRYVALFFVAVMLVGPGLIVNSVFKQHWGRPRPLDLQEFNRDSDFVEVWSLPVPGAGASFPSGHASVAFYLFTPYFVLRRRSWRWAAFFLALGLGYGTLMGVARMAQGAHFLSDIVWSAGFVYLTGLAFTYALRIDERAIGSAVVPVGMTSRGGFRFEGTALPRS